MMSDIKFRSLFLALLVSFGFLPGGTPTAYAQTEPEQTELTPICETPTIEGLPACWMKAENHDNCYIWNSFVRDEETVTWSGQCRAGKSHGRGKATWGWRYYGDDGDITLNANNTGSYVNGKKHGRWEEQSAYMSSGELDGVWTGRYINGKRQGRWRYQDSLGSTLAGPYVDGLPHGQWEERYSDGRVERGSYVDGKKQGQWVRERNNGYRYIYPYVDGKIHGVQKSFRDGDLAWTCNYYQGVEQSCDHDP